LVEQALDRTGGNAFFLEEVLRGLASIGSATDGTDAVGAPHVIPENLQRAVIARLDCLNPTDKYVLQTASVLGPSFSADVLQRMLASEFDAPSFVDCLERLRQHEFLRTTPGIDPPVDHHQIWTFNHALISDVAYSTLLRLQRRELHREAARCIEASTAGHPDERTSALARHYEMGSEFSKALTHLLSSAHSSLRLHALREASEYFRRAIRAARQCSDAEKAGAELTAALEGQADVEYMMGEYRQSLEHFEQALEHGDGQERQVRLLRKQAQVCEKWGRYDQAETVFEKGLLQIPQDCFATEAARIYSGLSRVHFHQSKMESAQELGQRALTMMTRLRDKRGMAQAHNDVGIVCTHEHKNQEAREHLDRSLQLWREIGDYFGLAACFNNRGLLASGEGQYAEARADYLQALAHFRRLGNRHGIARVFDNLSEVYLARNDLERASRYVGRAVRILADIGVDQTGVLPEMWQSGAW
jgi:tetratricopeptide (TPR) repeat protein